MSNRIDCPESCEIPDGVTLADVPPPRHNWSDVLTCPNDGCGRSFLVRSEEAPSPEQPR